jgi:hypothetical protein
MKKPQLATVQKVPVQYRKILDRHVTLSTITDWLNARECIIIAFVLITSLAEGSITMPMAISHFLLNVYVQ